MRHTYNPILVSAYQLNGYLVVYVVLDVINHEIEYTLQINVISWAVSLLYITSVIVSIVYSNYNVIILLLLLLLFIIIIIIIGERA